jgi:hypothetical protein
MDMVNEGRLVTSLLARPLQPWFLHVLASAVSRPRIHKREK